MQTNWNPSSSMKRGPNAPASEPTNQARKKPKTSDPSQFQGLFGMMDFSDQQGIETPVHSMGSTHNSHRGPMTYPRKRAVAACSRCRARKTKCDNQRPSCGFCASVGANCQYEGVSEHSSFDPASLHMIGCLNQIMKKQDDILTRLQQNHRDPGLVYPQDRDIASAQEQGQDDCTLADDGFDRLPSWESPADYLKIPSSRTTPDIILTWPIFEGTYSPDRLHTAIFNAASLSITAEDASSDLFLESFQLPAPRVLTTAFDETEVPRLVNHFLSFVHSKNPILDEQTLRRMASTVAEEGLRWDGPSCLVLLACALGTIASPFAIARSRATMDPQQFRHLPSPIDHSSSERAESLYLLARRRIGIPTHPIIAAQCFFLSGVYLMYGLRPIEAFQEFHQASVKFQVHLKLSSSSTKTDQMRKLEQRMYWSCFKSECEILSEIPLPESGIADIEYPHMFPSPPDPNESITSPASTVTMSEQESPSSFRASAEAHMQREQEYSWFYYLSEIALRRIGNRVLNAFYREENFRWADMNIQATIRVAEEFMLLLDQWYRGLPPLLRYNQEDLSNIPTEELTYMIRARMLEIKSWIFRPFLYYAIHHNADDQYQRAIKPFVDQAIAHSVRLIESSSIRHQHHGIWYTCRVSVSSALLILSAAKSGHVELPLEWLNTVQLAIETLLLWERHAPGDLKEARTILTNLAQNIVGEDSTQPDF